MYSMVLMAALTMGAGTPDFGYVGYGGLGWGGWSGSGLGWSGWGSPGWSGWGGYGWGSPGWGGWGGFGYTPVMGGYNYSPMISTWGWGAPFGYGGVFPSPGMAQSFYYNPAMARPMASPKQEARLIVHLPVGASLTIDDNPTLQRSDTRLFITPPLDPGKTYTYTLRGEINRDGRFVHETKTVEVKAGEESEVTLRFGDADREELSSPPTPNAKPSK